MSLSLSLFILLVAIILIVAVLLTPFPYWHAYFTIWRHILFDPEPSIKFSARMRQANYLLSYTLRLPFFALCWCFDELLFREYRNLPIRRPIFIVAQPRSATTFVHRTLAADEEHFFSIRLLEWRYPSIALQKLLKVTGFLDKMSRVRYWGGSNQAEVAEKMHYSYLNDYEDDGFLFEECVLYQFYVINRFPYPKLLSYLDSFDQLPAQTQKRMMQVHYNIIQKILYLRGGGDRIYVSKDNECLKKLAMMKEFYPDAIFITITRDSERFMNSYFALVSKSAYCKSGVDVSTIPAWMSTHLAYRVEAARRTIEFFQSLPQEQKICFSFERLVNNIADSIMLVYCQLGLSMSDKQRQYLKDLEVQQNLRESGYETGKERFQELEFFDRFAEEIDKAHEMLLKSVS